MASNKALSSTALFLSLNLLFFSMLSSASHSRHPPPPPPTSTTPPPPTSTTPPPPLPTCPINILNLSVCVNLLGGVIGSPSTSPCCSLIQGLVDLEAAVCLCTAIRANVLGIILNVDVALSLLLNVCGKRVPSGFQCR